MQEEVSMLRITWVQAALVALAVTSVAVAQQAPPAQPAQPAQRPGLIQQRREARQANQAQQRVTANRPVDGQTADQQIVNWLALCNTEEVELAKLAAENAKDAKVREFAQMLAKEHGQNLAQLEKFGAQRVRLEVASAGEGQRTARVDDGARPTAGQAGLDFNEIGRQIAAECIANAKKEWSEKGEDCDMAFVGQQIVAHKQMLSAMKVLRQYASPELQASIDKSTEATREHLDHAKQLIESLARAEQPSNK
jgi:predicted outer membrane protein